MVCEAEGYGRESQKKGYVSQCRSRGSSLVGIMNGLGTIMYTMEEAADLGLVFGEVVHRMYHIRIEE